MNGYVTLGDAINSVDPDVFAVPVPILMPFAGDLRAVLNESQVCYSVHQQNDSYISEIQARLQQLGLTQMQSKFALLVTYNRVQDFRLSQRASFQLLLISDGESTQVIYLYSNSTRPWTVSRRIQVGFSYGRLLDPINEYVQVSTFTAESDSERQLTLGSVAGNTG